MGMKGYLHWFAWMFKFSTSVTISCILITVIFFIPTRNGAIINHSDPFTILLFLYLYGIAVVTFGFAVSALFAHSKRSTGTLTDPESEGGGEGMTPEPAYTARENTASHYLKLT